MDNLFRKKNTSNIWVSTLIAILAGNDQILHIAKKIKRCIAIGVLSKMRYYVNSSVLKMLYYTLVFPLLSYSVVTWGNTYATTLKPLFLLQKKAIRE